MKYNNTLIKSIVFLGTALVTITLITACGSGSTENEHAADHSGQFVSDSDSTGSIRVDVTSSSIAVGNTSGFRVTVRNADGTPVQNIQIACTTEQGVALVEPSSGFELTDENGTMSGVVGCEAVGSFQLICRLPVGTNLRDFESILCTGARGDTATFDGSGSPEGGGVASPAA